MIYKEDELPLIEELNKAARQANKILHLPQASDDRFSAIKREQNKCHDCYSLFYSKRHKFMQNCQNA